MSYSFSLLNFILFIKLLKNIICGSIIIIIIVIKEFLCILVGRGISRILFYVIIGREISRILFYVLVGREISRILCIRCIIKEWIWILSVIPIITVIFSFSLLSFKSSNIIIIGFSAFLIVGFLFRIFWIIRVANTILGTVITVIAWSLKLL